MTRTTDPAVATRALERTHDAVRLLVRPERAPFRFDETVVATERLSLESTACTGSVAGVVTTASHVVVTWMKSGRGTIGEHRAPIGRPIVFHEDAEPLRWISFQHDTLRIDRAVVEEVAGERGGWVPQSIVFRPHHVPEGAMLAAWWLMVRRVAEEMLRGADEVEDDADLDLARYAAAGLLTAVPHWPAGQSESAPARARLARAEAFLLDHVLEPVTAEQMAAAAGMSVRGLQAAFQRAHSCTPTAYLRGIRLQMARDLLETGAVESVRDAALAVAMPHLGRFAAAYRSEFGVLPRDVLATARMLDAPGPDGSSTSMASTGR